MGGERETHVEKTEIPDKSGSVRQNSGSRLRIHENAGQVHFHDDENKLKVAVPVATWWRAWQELQQPGRWDYIDVDNMACLTVQTKLYQQDDILSVECELMVTRVGVIGTNYTELAKFTKKR